MSTATIMVATTVTNTTTRTLMDLVRAMTKVTAMPAARPMINDAVRRPKIRRRPEES
jgi:hypothetical protein